MKKIILLFTLVSSIHLSAQGFEKIKLSESEIPSGYLSTDAPQCISIQACTFYESPGMYSALIGKLKSKDIQNFENKKDGGSIMYFEFEKDFEMEAFCKAYFGVEKKLRQTILNKYL